MWGCVAVAQDVWADLLRCLQKWESIDIDFYNIWEGMTKHPSKSDLDEIACILRKVYMVEKKQVCI